MLLTIERVALLKSIDLFSATPDYVLAPVARIIREVELSPGETLIHEGDAGDCLFIVIDGEVRVHSHDKTILMLGHGQIVGELAVLDPEPRAASVTAVNEAFLLRLDKEPFDEVMADRPEIAQAVIRALTRRLRLQGQIITNSS